MQKKLIFSTLYVLIALSSFAQVNPQTSIETTIIDCISLLENKDYKTMFEKYIYPDDLQRILKERTMDEFIAGFQERKAERMLNALKLAKKLKIEYREEGTVGIIKLEKVENVPDDFVFRKVGDLWYISD